MKRCEALVLVEGMGRGGEGRYVTCGTPNPDLHHKITRARGGLILDAAGETYHQMYLCRYHHQFAHDEPAFTNGLLLRGSVVTGPDGKPVYTGPDPYLTRMYNGEVA